MIDTSKVKDFTGLFEECKNLQKINLTGVNTESAERFLNMFAGCHALTQLDISHFAAGSSLNYIDSMFRDCEQLTAVYVNQEFYDPRVQ